MSSERLYADLKPNVLNIFARARGFRSLRWKLTLPLLLVLLVAAMVCTYALTDGVTRGLRQAGIDHLLFSARGVSERAIGFGDTQRRELTRIAFTQGVPDALLTHDGAKLQSLIQPLAAAANLDYLIVGDADLHEVVGLQRGASGYSVTQGAALGSLPFAADVLKGVQRSASGLVHTEHGYALMIAQPITHGSTIIGIVVSGTLLSQISGALRGSSLAQVALYGPNSEVLYNSFPDLPAEALALPSITLQQALYTTDRVPIQSLQFTSGTYYVGYIPLVVDSAALGVVGVFEPNSLLYATESSRDLLSLVFSALAAALALTAYGLMGAGLHRLERVTAVTRALASGNPYARTEMAATDEIGELGRTLDIYAKRTQKKQDSLELSLRRQSRETARLGAVLESIPDGVIVQDLDGRVLMMNAASLALLGSQRAFRSSPLNELTAIVTDTLGVALAPGVYSLGDPQRVPMDGKILHAQAAAVLALDGQQRIGTVIVLRDITDEVRREQARDSLLEELARDARKPVSQFVAPGRPEDTLRGFIREVNRNAIALQRMIAEIRDLSTGDLNDVKTGQRALPVEPLLWNLASEWQPTAAASGIELHVIILQRDLYILGEERRLRWAIGNLVDNAIKYTPAGGHVTLMLSADDEERNARFSIRDTGAGISPTDLPHIFTRFYRGKPMTNDGRLIQTPGTGQGLHIAQRVIEAHGGAIQVQSEAGQGTEVAFELPLTASVTLEMAGRVAVPDAPGVPLAVRRV